MFHLTNLAKNFGRTAFNLSFKTANFPVAPTSSPKASITPFTTIARNAPLPASTLIATPIHRLLGQSAPLLCAMSTAPLLPAAPITGINKRFLSGRHNCSGFEGPRCAHKFLLETKCAIMKKEFEAMKLKKQNSTRELNEQRWCRQNRQNVTSKPNLFKSMWLNPECCKDPCKDVLPRFDDLYYKISDKSNRIYQQTWADCPPPRKVKRLCLDSICFEPPFQYRCPKKRPKTACPQTDKCMFRDSRYKACPRIKLPGCRNAIIGNRYCKPMRMPSNCKKICAPYPAYSECLRDKLKPLRPTECKCWSFASMCEVWELLRKQESIRRNH